MADSPGLQQNLTQIAPYPDALANLVERLTYRPGWRFWLGEVDRDKDGDGKVIGAGLTLDIITLGYNAYKPSDGETYRVHHYFIVPAATYDERAWTRWLFDQVVLVETHEAMEFFKVDKRRPFAPNHGPGRNPYSVLERGVPRRTRQRCSPGSRQREPSEMTEVSIARRLWDDSTAAHAQDQALTRDWFQRCQHQAAKRVDFPYGWLFLFPDGSFLTGLGRSIMWGIGDPVLMYMPPFQPSRN